ncbi:MAG: glycosyltransferase [Ignavibacteriota bacterium]
MPRLSDGIQEAFQIPNVRFGGFGSPRDIWRENHGLALTSRAEGLPIVVVEAMLCGRICIVTDVGGNCEVIQDGVDGFIARDVSPAGIAGTLERAWERRAEWRSMGERAAESIRRKVPRDPSAWLVQELRKMIDA